MFEVLRQRWESKTYRVAIIGALLTLLEQQSGVISQFVPVEYRQYLIAAWPLLMLLMREKTKEALAEK